jgi:hypothetical protein
LRLSKNKPCFSSRLPPCVQMNAFKTRDAARHSPEVSLPSATFQMSRVSRVIRLWLQDAGSGMDNNLPRAEIDADSVEYRETVHHGPLLRPLCIDVDGCQGLLAIGGSDGCVKVYGKRGVERKLLAPSPRHVSRGPAFSS